MSARYGSSRKIERNIRDRMRRTMFEQKMTRVGAGPMDRSKPKVKIPRTDDAA